MTIIEAIILGIIQGLAEFLPISSSGHLVLTQHLMGVAKEDIVFDLLVHLATVLSIITIFRKLIYRVFVETVGYPIHRRWNEYSKIGSFVLLGTVPTGIIGLTFKKQFEALFSNISAVGIFFVCTGVLLYLTKVFEKKSEHNHDEPFDSQVNKISAMSWKQAAIIGVAQGAAIAPGISRAGTTIAAGLLLGLPRGLASAFSFLLSIPAIVGASVLKLREANWETLDVLPMSAGFVAAYVSGLVGLTLVLRVVKKGRLEIFTVYLVILGIICQFL